jgi:hypothetical protein
MKSRRLGWIEHVERMADRKGAYRILVGKMRERDHWEEYGLDGGIIFKCTFKKWDGAWTGLVWLGMRRGGRILSMR